MTAYSKCFAATVGQRTCEQINHPGHSCLWFLGRNMRRVMPGCAQYFLPLILIAPLRKLNECTVDDLKESLLSYCRMCFFIYLCSISSQSLSCFIRHLQGRYTEAMGMLPITLGQLPTFLMPAKSATIVANSSLTMLTEALLMRDDTRIWRALRNVPALRTLLFMAMSATIMDVPAHIKRCGTFWFIQPAERRAIPHGEPAQRSPVMEWLRPQPVRVCLHAHSGCDEFVRAGVSAYLKVGVGIEVVRLVFGHFGEMRRAPLAVPALLVRRMNWRLVGFLGAYAALYRSIYCLLNRHNGAHSTRSNLAAAFLSAAAYRLYPNRTLLAHAIVSAARIAWLRLATEVAPSNAGVQWLDALPWAHLLHMVGVGGMYHVRTFTPYWAPSFMKKSCDLLSGGSYDFMIDGISKALLGLPPSKLVK